MIFRNSRMRNFKFNFLVNPWCCGNIVCIFELVRPSSIDMEIFSLFGATFFFQTFFRLGHVRFGSIRSLWDLALRISTSQWSPLLNNCRKINFKVYDFYSKFETRNSLWDLTLEISTLQWSPLFRIAKKKYFFKFRIFRNLRI